MSNPMTDEESKRLHTQGIFETTVCYCPICRPDLYPEAPAVETTE